MKTITKFESFQLQDILVPFSDANVCRVELRKTVYESRLDRVVLSASSYTVVKFIVKSKFVHRDSFVI